MSEIEGPETAGKSLGRWRGACWMLAGTAGVAVALAGVTWRAGWWPMRSSPAASVRLAAGPSPSTIVPTVPRSPVPGSMGQVCLAKQADRDLLGVQMTIEPVDAFYLDT